MAHAPRSLALYRYTLRAFRALRGPSRDYYTRLARVEFAQERALRHDDRIRALHEKGARQVAWLCAKYGAPPPPPWDASAPLR